ncbi:poly(A) RNA polymerase, mitochondrial isoform 2-T2 [Discoglossus pictus]
MTQQGTHAVVEYFDRDSIESLRAATRVPNAEDECLVPFKSRLFTIKTDTALDQTTVRYHKQVAIPINELIQKLCSAENIQEQMCTLLNEYQLTDESVRLRFLVSSLIRDLATAYFPEATVNPYGSTVNSFGKLGCDLDLFLDLDCIRSSSSGKTVGPFTSEYLMKRVPSGRVATQRILSVIGESIDHFGPGCTGVQKILNARCPLVRFSHQPAGLQCDLTSDNRIALRSSELLYIYGNFDDRVRSLVFTLRCWARVHGITSAIPGAWITNFALTTMILFFLQKRSTPVIPTLDHLKSLAGKEDKHIIDGNDCTFVSNLNKIKPSGNSETLDVLLSDFFEFYGNFDFSKNCIDIRKGKEQNKPEVSPLYLRNPFEPTLNISKNVNQSQLDRFVAIVRESAWIFQEQLSNPSMKGNQAWGLAAVLLPTVSQGIGKNKKKRKRGPASDRIKSLLESLKTNGKAR